MENVIIVRFGEINLKGKNKRFFEGKLIKHIRFQLKEFIDTEIYQEYSRLYIRSRKEDQGKIIEKVRKVFGIVSLSTAVSIPSDIDAIRKASFELMKERFDKEAFKTFRVTTKRANKKFPIPSMEVSSDVGGFVLKSFNGELSVDVHQPDVTLIVEIRQKTYITCDHFPAYGGLPLETNGSALLLLSGGIDSPVAGWMMGKRGVKVHAVHFHSYPFTSERAQEKILDLARELQNYIGEFMIFNVNLLKIQKAINEECPDEEMTIHSRRFMTRIAEKIAKRYELQALITGDNIGQVASQTMESLQVVSEVASIPIFRPLIAYDKQDIIKVAKEINTYEISIQPFEDCCSVFLPKKPLTRPRLNNIVESEQHLDVEGLVTEAIEDMEIMKLTFNQE